MCRDMDEWGYSFRLGSAATWFAEDAADARQWLLQQGLIDGESRITYACRAPALADIEAFVSRPPSS